jgi:hypothetical protein
VRDGDPDALAGLCERRGPAVLAYCRIVAGDSAAAAAAAEAFARFRAAVVAAEDLANLNPEALLVSATRHAAAHHASVVASGVCAEVPVLLAGRADRSISAANVEFLEGHLDTCWTCRAPVARFEAAERAYRDPPDDAVPPDAAKAIVAALAAAAPIRGAGEEPAAPAEVARVTAVAATNGNGHHDAPAAQPEDRAATDEPEHATTEHRALEDDEFTPRPRSSNGHRGARRRRREPAGPLAAVRGAIAAGGSRAPRGRTAEPRLTSGIYLPRPERTVSPVSGAVSGGRRERGTLRPSVVLPVVLLASALLVALFVAGVFGSDSPTPSRSSVAPAPAAPHAATKTPEVVVVPGAKDASASAVERAKARARAETRRQAAPGGGAAPTPAKPTTPRPPPAAASPAPSNTPAPAPPAAGTGGTTAKPKPAPKAAPRRRGDGARVDAGHGATGVEPQLPKQKSKTVPELTPPAEPTTPPTPQPPG